MNNTSEHIRMKLFKWAKLTKANGRSNHLISIFSPFSSFPLADYFAFSKRRGILWSWATFSFWSLQPRTMSLCSPWPAVGKRATLESSDSSDWKSENVGLPVQLRMPSFQKRDSKNFLVFFFRPFLLFSKPIKIDPTTELSRVARFVKLA